MPRPVLLAAGVLCTLNLAGLSLAGNRVLAQTNTAVPSANRAEQQVGGGLSVAEARAAANRILAAVQSRDPNRRFALFSERLQAISSPRMVAETMAEQPRLLSWTLLSVRRGLNTTTVEASLQTSAGPQDLFMVLDGEGRLDGYHLDLTDAKASQVAGDFVRALGGGHFITARSFLSLPMQEELPPAALQDRWQRLQRYTGTFQGVRRVVTADRNEDSQLVLVSTEFNRVTDTLFVVLNLNNEIVSVDFPQDPIRPAASSAPLR